MLALASTACGGSSTEAFATGGSGHGQAGDGTSGVGGSTGGTSSGGDSGTAGSGAQASVGGTGASGGASSGGTAGSATGGTAGSKAVGGASGAGGAARGGSSGSSGAAGASGSGTGGSAMGGGSGAGSGGVAGTGSAAGGSGAAGTGGGCNFECPAVACGPIVALTVKPDTSSGAQVIQNLKAEGTGPLTLTCSAFSGDTPCTWLCQSSGIYTLTDGDYSVTLSAPGYAAKTIDFTVTNPTNCGCCGCGCSIGTQETVELMPDSTLESGGCCADLENDATNCGACGRKCPANMCGNGTCLPNFGQCLFGGTDAQTNTSYQNCNDYCASVGQVCSASCGGDGNEASEEWLNPTQNCYSTAMLPTVRGCADPFEQTVNGQVPQYHCCCGEASK